MMAATDPHKIHKKHRNVLYSLVVLLAIIQIVAFTVMSLQISALNVKLDSELEKTASDLKAFSENLMGTYDSLYQENFNEISTILTQQQEDFEQEINLLKSTQDDFSGIAEDAIKSVVTVSSGGSVGSGFIITESGYFVTNYHVINGQEDSVQVLDYNRNVRDAEFIGADSVRDLALLKLSGQFEVLELAATEDVQVGEKVIAIGNPLGLSFTVTEGIVSAVDRVGPNGLEEYVQTDVSLNPGNSGGPLIDATGKVVGINNFKIGGAESLGFALESDIIRDAVNQIANQTLLS